MTLADWIQAIIAGAVVASLFVTLRVHSRQSAADAKREKRERQHRTRERLGDAYSSWVAAITEYDMLRAGTSATIFTAHQALARMLSASMAIRVLENSDDFAQRERLISEQALQSVDRSFIGHSRPNIAEVARVLVDQRIEEWRRQAGEVDGRP